jgi:hypothetical protein
VARYDNDPHVGYVYIGGPGISIGSYVVQNEDDYQKFAAAGGLPEWIKGVEAVIDMYGASFKNTPFLLALGNSARVPSLHGQGEQAVREVLQYGITHYPDRFGVAGHGLNANSATRGAGFFVNQLIAEYSTSSPVGFQMMGPASGDHPFGKVGDLTAAISAGLDLQAHFIEVYQADCKNPAYAQLFQRANAQLGSRVPR